MPSYSSDEHVAEPAAAALASGRKPRALPERVTTVRWLLAAEPRPIHAEDLARRFQRNPRDDVQAVLSALVGLARRVDGNRYAPQ